MFLIKLIEKGLCSFLGTYYEYKQSQYMEKIMPKLKTGKYTITDEVANKFNTYQYYKLLLKSGNWKLFKRQYKNEKNKIKTQNGLHHDK